MTYTVSLMGIAIGYSMCFDGIEQDIGCVKGVVDRDNRNSQVRWGSRADGGRRTESNERRKGG